MQASILFFAAHSHLFFRLVAIVTQTPFVTKSTPFQDIASDKADMPLLPPKSRVPMETMERMHGLAYGIESDERATEIYKRHANTILTLWPPQPAQTHSQLPFLVLIQQALSCSVQSLHASWAQPTLMIVTAHKMCYS